MEPVGHISAGTRRQGWCIAQCGEVHPNINLEDPEDDVEMGLLVRTHAAGASVGLPPERLCCRSRVVKLMLVTCRSVREPMARNWTTFVVSHEPVRKVRAGGDHVPCS